jgi:hypothetical protein
VKERAVRIVYILKFKYIYKIRTPYALKGSERVFISFTAVNVWARYDAL